MSRISGHYAITRRALVELRWENPQDVFIRDFQNTGASGALSDNDFARLGILDESHFDAFVFLAGEESTRGPEHTSFVSSSSRFVTTMCDSVTDLADGAVCKDLEDVIDGNHWSPLAEAQAGHFMRAPQDRPREAYAAAVKWILRNVNGAAAAMSAAYGATLTLGPADLQGHHHGRKLPPPGSGRLTGGRAAKLLGRAVHCVQDSFSASHVRRAQGTEMAPGSIEDIYVYTQQDAKIHEIADRAWMQKARSDDSLGGHSARPARFSLSGMEAVNATKGLISLAVWAAENRKADVELTERWERFRAQWLPCAPFLGT